MKTHSDELAVFVQVVESGSFSRAAERLGLANSAVSRTVKRLEDKLSANLLNRTTRQLRLTEEGCRFFERARQILHDIEAAEAEILSAGGAPQGVLRVDSATPTLLHLVAPLVRPFCERYPQVSLLLTSSEGYIDLIERRVDIAIRAGSLHDSALRARHLFDSRLKLVAAPDYLARYGTPQIRRRPVAAYPHRLLRAQNPEQLAVCRHRPHSLRRRAATVRQQRRNHPPPVSGRQRHRLPVGFHRRRRYCSGTPARTPARARLKRSQTVLRRLLRRQCRQPENPGFCGFFGRTSQLKYVFKH
ncbi:hypothetical protein HMPREF1028_01950 [Neisseria sp. GT4A_CT1]|nr:hypothetical protein HMPREF1028_01950 [Neisseria sp. GT4A_CT1]